MKFKAYLKQKGQTSIEYLLLIVVAFTICIRFKKAFEDFMFKNPNSYITRSLGGLVSKFEADSSGRYRRFSIR